MPDRATFVLIPEARAFLERHRRVFVLDRRRDGSPTIHPMTGEWRDAALWVNTYRRSQKVVNVGRDSRASYLVASDDAETPFGAVNVKGLAAVVEPVPGEPGDQRTGFTRPLRPGELAKRIRLQLVPRDVTVIH